MISDPIKVPILIIGFNRPEVIKQTFSFIKKAMPKKLYISVDGARDYVIGEAEKVQQVKRELSNIDWDCEIHHKYNDRNMGAEITVSTAVTWALENEDYIIVLEDDIIAPISFLNFAQKMLLKYKDEENIFMISGGNFSPLELSKFDYCFAYNGHTGCGWATWKRAWNKFFLDIDFNITKEELKMKYLTKKEVNYNYELFKKMRKKGRGHNTWDICWSFARVKNSGLSIVPRNNLTSNIGVYGLHDKGKTKMHFLHFDENFDIKNEPSEIFQDKEYDLYHFNKYIYKPFWKRCINKLNVILKVI